MAEGDANFRGAVCDLGPDLPAGGIDQPNAAAIGAGEVARHVCVEFQKSVCIGCSTDLGRVFKDHAGDPIGLGHLVECTASCLSGAAVHAILVEALGAPAAGKMT